MTTAGTVPKECAYCGKAFLARVDALKIGHGKLCSVSCANDIRRQRVRAGPRHYYDEKECEQCGLCYLARVDGPQRFCSRRCSADGQRVSVEHKRKLAREAGARSRLRESTSYKRKRAAAERARYHADPNIRMRQRLQNPKAAKKYRMTHREKIRERNLPRGRIEVLLRKAARLKQDLINLAKREGAVA